MNVGIKEIPKEERPRERLINYGVENLSNEELLCIILKSGTKDNSVKVLANRILKEVESINNLKDMTFQKLVNIKGIKQAKACEILSSIELGKRINQKLNNINKIKIVDSNSVFNYYKNILQDKKQEFFYCVYLDTKNQIIKDKLLFVGTINQSIVHPREVFKEAYLLSASAIICVHNHPTGNVKPSKNDILITKQLKEVGVTMGINIIDHIIVGKDEYYSFVDNGII